MNNIIYNTWTKSSEFSIFHPAALMQDERAIIQDESVSIQDEDLSLFIQDKNLSSWMKTYLGENALIRE